MEVENFLYIPSASWRLRKTSHVIQSASKGMKTRGANGLNPSLRAREDDTICPHSTRQAGSKMRQSFPSLCLLFCSSPQWINWCPHWDRQYSWLSSSIQMIISSRNTSQTHPDRMFYLGTPWPVKFTHKLCHHTTIVP